MRHFHMFSISLGNAMELIATYIFTAKEEIVINFWTCYIHLSKLKLYYSENFYYLRYSFSSSTHSLTWKHWPKHLFMFFFHFHLIINLKKKLVINWNECKVKNNKVHKRLLGGEGLQKNLYQNIDADVKMIIIHCIQCLNKISSLSALNKTLISIKL